MTARYFCAVAFAAPLVTSLLFSDCAMATDMPVDAAACKACHSIENKIVGPAWKDIANKYAGDKEAAKKIAANITKGGKFGWNFGAMPPKGGTQKTDAEIMKLAEFIVGLVSSASPAVTINKTPSSVINKPTFESVSFGKQSTHCDEKSDSRSIMHEGRSIIVGFNRMKAGVSTKARFPDRVRCDVTLKLTTPLEAPAVIEIDVHGDSRVTGSGTTSATFTMLGRKDEINFHPMDDAGVQRFAAKLPKGAQQLDFSIEATAHGEPPDSTAIIAIGSLDIGFDMS